MAPDMNAVMYKVLKYAEKCMKADVEPSLDEARKLSGVGNVYFTQVMIEAADNGLISGLYIPNNIDTPERHVFARHMAITLDGTKYLEENSLMKKTASLLGTAAVAAIDNAVNATIKAALGY